MILLWYYCQLSFSRLIYIFGTFHWAVVVILFYYWRNNAIYTTHIPNYIRDMYKRMTTMMIIIILMILACLALLRTHSHTLHFYHKFSLPIFRFRLIIFNKILLGLSSSINKRTTTTKKEKWSCMKGLWNIWCPFLLVWSW